MPRIFLFVLAIYSLLAAFAWILNVIIRLRLKFEKKIRLERYVGINKLKPVLAKGILATFGLSIISLLTSFLQEDGSVRQGLIFISALSAISTFYLVALWSFPKFASEFPSREIKQPISVRPAFSKHEDWKFDLYSKMPQKELWKLRKVLIIACFLFLSVSFFLSFLLLKAMGATNNEAFVFIAAGALLTIFGYVRKMGKSGLRKNQLEQTFGKADEQE